MHTNYYYLISSLPTLEFDDYKNVSVEVFLEKILTNLTPEDLRLVNYLQKSRDIENLLSAGENRKSYRQLGNIPVTAFTDPDTEIELPEDWKQYILSSKGEKPISIDQIRMKYFDEGLQIEDKFIQAWTRYELALLIVLTTLRHEKLADSQGAFWDSEFFENSENRLIHDIPASGRLPDFGLGHEFDWAISIRELFESENPKEIELALDKYRWEFIDGLIANCHFSHEVVLGYILKLLICERWKRLDQKTGENRLESILGGTSGE